MNISMVSFKQYVIAGLVLIVISGVVLFLMGQVPICKCGYVKLWHGVTFSSENSQHISDWYTFSHIIHGFAFYLLFWLIGKRYKWPVGLRFFLAVLLEVSWEIFENTDLIINRYREVTISLDYYGDSILNSIFDSLAMVVGFVLAARLPVWMTVSLLVLMEVFVGYHIRDNLTLNIIMLIYPNDAVLNWQSAK